MPFDVNVRHARGRRCELVRGRRPAERRASRSTLGTWASCGIAPEELRAGPAPRRRLGRAVRRRRRVHGRPDRRGRSTTASCPARASSTSPATSRRCAGPATPGRGASRCCRRSCGTCRSRRSSTAPTRRRPRSSARALREPVAAPANTLAFEVPPGRLAASSEARAARLRVAPCVLAIHPPAAPLGATALTGTTTRGAAMAELDRDRLIWMYTQMLRIREFEERVKRSFEEHPGRDPRAHAPRGRRGGDRSSARWPRSSRRSADGDLPLPRLPDRARHRHEGDHGRDLRSPRRAVRRLRRVDAPRRSRARVHGHERDRRPGDPAGDRRRLGDAARRRGSRGALLLRRRRLEAGRLPRSRSTSRRCGSCRSSS